MALSERYQKTLVTVAMGLRTEEDIRNNGLYIFPKSDKDKLIKYVTKLFNVKPNLLVLKVKPTGYRSEHINITNKLEFDNFIASVDDIYGENNEIWVVSSSVLNCWRCRIYLSADLNLPDRIEMAKSDDDHILDHIAAGNKNVPYVCFVKALGNNFELTETNVDNNTLQTCQKIIKDIYSKFSYDFKSVKEDMELLKIAGISLDCRVNNGYDFHDFDVSYGEVKKVVDFYVPMYLEKQKRKNG